jgi:cell division protease FtsH
MVSPPNLEQTHQRLRKILSERRKALDNLAHLLSEKEVVQGEELRQMLSESTDQGNSA